VNEAIIIVIISGYFEQVETDLNVPLFEVFGILLRLTLIHKFIQLLLVINIFFFIRNVAVISLVTSILVLPASLTSIRLLL